MQDAGYDVLPIAAHNGKKDQIQSLIEQTLDAYGTIDVLINNAATNPHFGPILQAEDSMWQKTIEVNLMGNVWLTQQVVPIMEKNGGGNAQIEARLEQWNALHDALALQGIDDFIQVDLGIVRGLAYYTGFVFEAFETSSQGRALAGGGRYDQLVEKLGGPAMPAVGFGFGDVMIELVLQRLEKMPPYQPALDVYFVFSRGEMESRLVMTRVHRLRRAGLRVDYSLKSIGFGKQFREASRKGARRVVICGVEEAEKGIFKVKTMSTGEEVEVPACDLEKFFKEHV